MVLCSTDLKDHKEHDRTHNIPWQCLENVVSAFEIALVNRAYSPFADPGPNLRLGPGSEKGEYTRFTKAILNALTTFSRHRHKILWISIMFLMILQISRA